MPVRDDDPRAAIGQEDLELAGSEPGVERDGHRAQLEGADEGGREADAVVHEERDALLGLDAQLAEPVGRAIRQRGELAIGVRALGSHDGLSG